MVITFYFACFRTLKISLGLLGSYVTVVGYVLIPSTTKFSDSLYYPMRKHTCTGLETESLISLFCESNFSSLLMHKSYFAVNNA